MEKPTLSLQWHITTKCDQRCTHCYIFRSSLAKEEQFGEKKITIGKNLYWIAENFIQSCKRLRAIPRITLTGGNPLLHSRFWDILKYLYKKGVRTHIAGNPFGITNESAKKLKRFGIDRFQLSLDGMPRVHDSIRKSGSFKETVGACEVLLRYGIGVGIMSTVSRENANEIPQLAREVTRIGARVFAFARYCSPGKENLLQTLTPEEYRNVLTAIWDTYQELANQGTIFVLKDHLWIPWLEENNLFTPRDTQGIIVDGCGIGISHMTVLANGEVFACRRFHSPIGNALEEHFDDIFMGQKMQEYREFLKLEKCSRCELLYYCRGCPAAAYAASERWTAPDPQCWKAV